MVFFRVGGGAVGVHFDDGGLGVGDVDGGGDVFVEAEGGGEGARVGVVAGVGAVGLPRLAGGGGGEVVVGWGAGWGAGFVVGEFAEGGAFGLLAAVWGRGGGLGVGEEFGALAGGGFRGGGGEDQREFFFHYVFPPPFSEGALVDVQPVLLGTDDHAGTHESHEGDYFVGGEAVPVDEVCADEAPGSAEAGFAVHRNSFVFDGDHFMGKLDEFLDESERWTGAVVEYHIQVIDAKGGEVGWRVEFRI